MTGLGESSDVDEFPRVKNRTCDWCDEWKPCTFYASGAWKLCDRCLPIAIERDGGAR